MRAPLPEPLPGSPLELLEAWMQEAAASIRNANAMTLATVEPDGRPSARVVLCRGFDKAAGWLVFYTDRESPKGRALDANPRAALVFHWDALELQVRVEGPVTATSATDADAYWLSRPPDARIAAAASEQSRPIATRQTFLRKLEETAGRSGGEAPRPARWGGYRVWAERVELWVGQPARAHDRAEWTRALAHAGDGFTGGPWSATRLQP